MLSRRFARVTLSTVSRLGAVRACSSAAGVKKPPNPSFLTKLYTNEWITEEAEYLIHLNYKRHKPLAVTGSYDVPQDAKDLKTDDLEVLNPGPTYPIVSFGDRLAATMVRALIPFTHLFFRDKYNHHACVLETVAAVPGMVAAVLRHMRSLRTMRRDNGWINPLLEEAENERMHLLVWMQVTQPRLIEKILVMAAQSFYATFYAALYLFWPRTAHRFVGYLEEEAVRAYSDYLKAIEAGVLPNGPAPKIAIKYWNLPENATLRDVVLVVRADECMHRNANHHLSDLLDRYGPDTQSPFLGQHELPPRPEKFKFKHDDVPAAATPAPKKPVA